MSYINLHKPVPDIICDGCQRTLNDSHHLIKMGTTHFCHACHKELSENLDKRKEYYRRRIERIQELKGGAKKN